MPEQPERTVNTPNEPPNAEQPPTLLAPAAPPADSPEQSNFEQSEQENAEPDLPEWMTNRQIGAYLGMTPDAARMAGTRNMFGPSQPINGRHRYHRDAVRKYKNTSKTETYSEKHSEQGERTEIALSSQRVFLELLQSLNENTRQGGALVEVTEQLVRVVGSQQEQIADLSAELKAEREHSRKVQEALDKEREEGANKPRTWWGRLFGG